MKKFQIFFITIVLQWSQTLGVQNLCGDARAAGFTFADDPSGTDRYLYCDFNSDGSVNTTHLLRCDKEFPYFFEDKCWSECPTGNCQACPELNKIVFYATEGCKEFDLCHTDSTHDFPPCGEFRNFDRSSGVCVLEQFAPCTPDPIEREPDCTNKDDNVFIVVPGTGCTMFALCFGGNVAGRWQCPEGHIFDSTKNHCAPKPHNFVCNDGVRIQNELKNIPRAPNYSPPKGFEMIKKKD